MKTLHQLNSFVSSALFNSENEKSERKERFKSPVLACVSSVFSRGSSRKLEQEEKKKMNDGGGGGE